MFAGKVAIITGGGSGIGEASAKELAREGASVVVADYNEQDGQRVAEEIKAAGQQALFVKVDVSKEEDVQQMVQRTVEEFGGVHILFANAGIGDITPAAELSLDKWNQLIGINLTGVFLCCKHVIPEMQKAGGGSIINNASILGHVGQPGVTSYTAAKAGVVNLSRTLALDYAKDNIRVNSVCPGYIETPLLKELDEKARNFLVSRHPIGRLGRPEEIAKAVKFLASDDASFVTGASLLVDGGYTAQ
jgi:NAD(P)-dependent dehydrogenase (short-subunit alcohol dehydrogenase family)